MSSEEASKINSFVTLNSGHKFPLIGFGTSKCLDDEMRAACRAALDAGYRSIDTAFLYSNEEAIGDVLQEYFSQKKLSREDVFVTTKLPPIANRPSDVARFLKKSLAKLQLDYVDLYLIHLPFSFKYVNDEEMNPKTSTGETLIDIETDLEAVWKEMEKQVDAGLTRAIGVSNFNSNQLDRMMKIARIPPAVNQVEMHAYLQQQKLRERCAQLGIIVVAYSPLGAPYTPNPVSPSMLENPMVQKIAKRHEKSASQILIRFVIQLKIPALPKSCNPNRIKSNIDVFDFCLTEDEMAELRKLDNKNGRIYTFTEIYKGIEHHKEYPFHIEF